jgi:hypothetical protein
MVTSGLPDKALTSPAHKLEFLSSAEWASTFSAR